MFKHKLSKEATLKQKKKQKKKKIEKGLKLDTLNGVPKL